MRKKVAFFELFSVLALIFICAWSLRDMTNLTIAVIGIGFMLLFGWVYKPTLSTMGLHVTNLDSAMDLVYIAIPAVVMSWILGLWWNTIQDHDFGGWIYVFARYLVWVCVQQMIVFSIIYPRLELICSDPRRRAKVICVIFGFSHFPNPAITLVCGIGGWVFARHFEKYRTIWPQVIVQWLVGITLSQVVPGRFTYGMLAGLRCLDMIKKQWYG